MPNYQKMYCYLFNQITDMIEQLQNVQAQAEDIYIISEDFEANTKTDGGNLTESSV